MLLLVRQHLQWQDEGSPGGRDAGIVMQDSLHYFDKWRRALRHLPRDMLQDFLVAIVEKGMFIEVFEETFIRYSGLSPFNKPR